MKISLLTVPVEAAYQTFYHSDRPGTDVFVTNRSEGTFPVMPKIAIVSLIKWMEKNGFDKSQYDFYDIDMLLPSDESLIKYLQDYRPNVVGLSAVVSTCYLQVKRLSKIIREVCPDAWIVQGGSLAASANLVLNKVDVDVCIVGDGEIPFVDFLNYVKTYGREVNYEALSLIKGLSYLDQNKELHFTGYGNAIPGEENVFPDYELLKSGLKDRASEIQNYFRPGLGPIEFRTDKRSHEPDRRPMMAQLWSSKGCVARCTFCQRSTKGYRVLGGESLDEHLEMLKRDYNVGFIHILDENFGSDKKYAHEVADIMEKHGMLWIASGVRVSTFRKENFEYLRDRGCCGLKFGVESGSQFILDVMEKRFTIEKVEEILGIMADMQMYSPIAVMVGMPGESVQTARETGAFLGRLSYKQGIDPYSNRVTIFYALPLTGTPLYQYGQKIGTFGKSPDEEEAILLSVSGNSANKGNYINLNGSSPRDVIWWDWLVKLEAQRTYYDLLKKNPLPPPSFIHKIVREAMDEQVMGKPLTVTKILADALLNQNFVGIKSKLFGRVFNWFEDEFMEKTVFPSVFATKIPRFILYPVLRTCLYAVYLSQLTMMTIFNRRLNLWKKWPKVERILPPAVRKVKKVENSDTEKLVVDINLSLRQVVKNRNLNKVPNSKTEKFQDILSAGM